MDAESIRQYYKKILGIVLLAGWMVFSVTYIINDGSNPPCGYVMVSTENESSHICYPENISPIIKKMCTGGQIVE